jgi:branched-subunit amino acid transport protein AzlD
MINAPHSLAIIAVVALCTFMLRAVPFVIFRKKKTVPEAINYLGQYLPAAIMAALVIYCLRNVNFLASSHGIPELVAVALVIILHSWKKNILLTVLVSTVVYMVMVQL